MRYNLVPIKVAIIKKQKITSVGENVERLEALCIVGSNVKRCKTIWWISEKLNIEYHMIQ